MPNVLFVTIDCLRADRLGYLGGTRVLSPHIDQLSHQAVFTQAYSTGPRTAESLPAILASVYPLTFGGVFTLPQNIVPLSEIFQRMGYATAAFHSNPFLSARFGYHRGYDSFSDLQSKKYVGSKLGASLTRIFARGEFSPQLYRLLRRFVRYVETGTSFSHYAKAGEITSSAIEWLSRQTGSTFLWLHYMDLHYPLSPPDNHVRKIRPNGYSKRHLARLLVKLVETPDSVTAAELLLLKDLYDAALSYVDENVGLLIETLSRLGRLQDTLIILTSDHGEEFYEHGALGHGETIHYPQQGRALIKLYDELLHVPLIISGSHVPDKPVRVSSLISLIDIPPTVADLIGFEIPDQWQGISLAPLIQSQTKSLRSGVFSGYAVRDGDKRHPIVSYRTEAWKYIHDGAFGRHELYDLTMDPEEKSNIYSIDYPLVPAMAPAVDEHLAMVSAGSTSTKDAQLDPAILDRLRNLGYVE